MSTWQSVGAPRLTNPPHTQKKEGKRANGPLVLYKKKKNCRGFTTPPLHWRLAAAYKKKRESRRQHKKGMEGKGHNDETTSLDCARWLPDEILDVILVGVSTSGEPFLDVRWRWAASRVCRRWRAIVVAVPYVPRLQHLLPGRGHRIRRHVQQGRTLCLSIYGQFGARARPCDMPRPLPLLMHLMRIAADQLDAVEPASMSMRDMRTSEDGWRMLGPLAHCGPCDRLVDANTRHWCVMCRVAARAGATNCFAVL